MNLKESIISDGLGYRGPHFDTNYFFSNLAKGFVKDKELLGEDEDVVALYTDVFGEEMGPIFEAFDMESETLSEAINSNNHGLLFEINSGAYRPPAPDAYDKLRSQAPFKGYKLPKATHPDQFVSTEYLHGDKVKSTGVLASLWDGIKKFGGNLAARFPGVASFLKNGIGWITAHPGAVLGVAGGAALLGGVIRALNKRGQNKKAAELQAKLDAAKKPAK